MQLCSKNQNVAETVSNMDIELQDIIYYCASNMHFLLDAKEFTCPFCSEELNKWTATTIVHWNDAENSRITPR